MRTITPRIYANVYRNGEFLRIVGCQHIRIHKDFVHVPTVFGTFIKRRGEKEFRYLSDPKVTFDEIKVDTSDKLFKLRESVNIEFTGVDNE